MVRLLFIFSFFFNKKKINDYSNDRYKPKLLNDFMEAVTYHIPTKRFFRITRETVSLQRLNM